MTNELNKQTKLDIIFGFYFLYLFLLHAAELIVRGCIPKKMMQREEEEEEAKRNKY